MKTRFFVVENFEFSGVDYCCTMCTNYTEPINSEDSKYWVSAMQKEFDSLVENNTFEWQKALKDRNIIGTKWVHTQKYKHDRSHEYKTRFVAKSYLKIYGEDHFAPMTNMASIRLPLLACQKALKVKMGIMFGNFKNPYTGQNRAVEPGIRHFILKILNSHL